ncbi:hypothetical protein FA15DRAFT_276629 [Coprinopsis marcescibilis]|uniref:C2H2-type domain-containing protein n=1 Tax=Coprinopsis marcescibilis TaxID=230819 RepID=A0A5C3L0K1_COPMA|nr:hypothetical protein FA15DRAFT_276629 [Coprinopsis marcescibilis]
MPHARQITLGLGHPREEYAASPPPPPTPSAPTDGIRIISPTVSQPPNLPPPPKPILPPIQPTHHEVFLLQPSSAPSPSSKPLLPPTGLPLPASPIRLITKSPGKESAGLAPVRTQGTTRIKRQAQKSPSKDAFFAAQKGERLKQRSPDELATPNGSEQSPESAGAQASSSRADSEASDDPKRKRFLCPQGCGKSFTRKNDVQRHLRSTAAHRDITTITEKSTFRCKYCNRILSRGDAARRHETEGACGKRTLPSERDKLAPVESQEDAQR